MARKAPKREAVLEFIKSHGTDGASFSEIQRFIVTMNGKNYDEMQPVYGGGHQRRWRGYWCDYLSHSWSGNGIIADHLEKNSRGKYVIREVN